MIRYLLRRLLWAAFVLVCVCALTFVLFFLLPSGDPAVLRAGRDASPETLAQIRTQLGLDDPVYVQFWTYLKGVVLHFDLGYSYFSGASVSSLLLDRLPATISLALGAALLWLAIATPIGIVSALHRRTWVDRVFMGGALIAISAPVYWVGLIVLYLFADDIGRFPLLPGADSYVGLTDDPGAWFGSMLLPWLVLAGSFAGIYARMLRTSLIETMGRDFIRTARAKGISERRVVLRHGVRVAITPVVTLLGVDLGVLLGGAILTERVFNIPGIGGLSLDAIRYADFPVIQGTVLLAALFVVLANLVVDVVYAFLDPRVRYG
ncbi:ABC transporter permease [Conexibacter sp. CPCC 206217]|uniref:ABC transporter permease n=1 Tax=Conexibacter sp. CPCC 206217 TaxID=3064574 RepID=UPI00272116F4|nr:ABC transporter permease [Conexibacter sp. CPCC 206217]MDO8211521.1 ABC transporter permease [Conexibacter sp. CPCC 206217]